VKGYLYLDTSMFPEIVDHLNAERVVDYLVNGPYQVLVSAYNLIEVVVDGNVGRRDRTLRLMDTLRGGRLPLAFPRDLLHRSLEAYLAGTDYTPHLDENDEVLCLLDPAAINTSAIESCTRWKACQEQSFQDRQSSGRQPLQEALKTAPAEERDRLQNNSNALIEFYCKYEEFLDRQVRPFIKRLGFDEGAQSRAVEIVREVDPWRFFLEAQAQAIACRGLKPSRYGKRANPGPIDFNQLVYFAGCDVLVTADKALYREARIMASRHTGKQAWDLRGLDRETNS